MTSTDTTSQEGLSAAQPKLSMGPEGLDGWLILPIINLCGTIGVKGFGLINSLSHWDGLKVIMLDPTDKAVALRLPFALSMFDGLTLLIIAAASLHRIYARSPSVPKLMTIYYIAVVIADLIELWASSTIAVTLGRVPDYRLGLAVIGGLLAALIWIPYFHKSKRVANTFRARESQIDKELPNIFS